MAATSMAPSKSSSTPPSRKAVTRGQARASTSARGSIRGGESHIPHSPERVRVEHRFVGHQQPTRGLSRKIAMVDESRGGSDFRTVSNASSVGRQVLSRPHTRNSPQAKFGSCKRFHGFRPHTPGPKYRSPSSFKQQAQSHRRTAPNASFGTSTRDSAQRLYALGH